MEEKDIDVAEEIIQEMYSVLKDCEVLFNSTYITIHEKKGQFIQLSEDIRHALNRVEHVLDINN